ncbi:MAG TPA: hypothetical protein VFI60_04250 [Candidatus Acidoferrum sp.]|nr:hypothetical protein [Candidatus Acidoferrum sp.]
MSGGMRRIAQLGIVVQFAALIRCLGEYFRLKYLGAASFSIARVEPFILGALVSAVSALVGVLFYFGESYRAAVAIAVLNVGILFILRFALL